MQTRNSHGAQPSSTEMWGARDPHRRHPVPQPRHRWPSNHHDHQQQQEQEPQQSRHALRHQQLTGRAPACRFIHEQCDKQLFRSEYLRSNKASGHKNLRCFPHCCRGHNPKSFCGSGLLVECADPRVQIALGRFEEANRPPSADNNQVEDDGIAAADDDAILLGHTYARDDLSDEIKTQDNPFGRWFNGLPVHPNDSHASTKRPNPDAPDHSCVFLINGNRQSWHYGWQSSRLNCKNHHVFKVYFFQSLDAAMSTLQCIATLQSPPFRVSSSRKARKTIRSPSMASDDASASAFATSVSVPSPDRMSVDSQEDVATVPSIRVRSPTMLHHHNIVQLPVTPSSRTVLGRFKTTGNSNEA
ncbi:hypothetical protein ATCC90586_005414 [Pythium insidiosum]|nr:hypothetical protein ATCC90586_005414 [Pythium insidiosum]